MTKAQREVIQSNLNNEKKVIKELQQVYNQASKDVEDKISALNARTDMQNLQSIVYQRQYQEALQSQLDGILDSMQTEEFTTIADYLTECYTNGYTGAMYDISKQGIPIISPIRQDEVVKALQTDSQLSTSMYNRLGEDVNYLKNSIRAELSRGIASGESWLDMAEHIANGMNSPFDTAINNAIRIARTEGNRIQNEAQLDAMQEAKDNGADVLKQWCATLDGDTREEHQELDGQIRELDDEFEVDGYSAMAPGEFGEPEMDINCRCCMLQRARWALDADELKELEERAEFYGLDKTDDFEDFKEKYLDATSDMTPETEQVSEVIDYLQQSGITYNEVQDLERALTDEEIIARVGGGDLTRGSCSSLALTYIANKNGMDVLDFRGGSSLEYFARNSNIRSITELAGVNGKVVMAFNEQATTMELLRNDLQVGKEYYLAVGRHAAVVRKTETELQYLELQSSTDNGFKTLTTKTLHDRFRATRSHTVYGIKVQSSIELIDGDSLANNGEFKQMMGYINTATDNQLKGSAGSVK